jgi:6-phosphogluconolactonase
MSMTKHNVTVSETADRVAERAAELFAQSAAEAIRERGRFVVALAGGSTPEKAYRVLAATPGVEWDKVLVFVGDERMVPVDDPRSNLGMARRALLDHVPIPPANIYAVPTGGNSAEQASRRYQQVIADVLGGSLPRFDLIFLGLGDDGHTASLFPGKPALEEQTAWVVASPPGELPPPVDRVTLTFPVLNAARRVAFLIMGSKKATILNEVLKGRDYPATRVRPTDGELIWLVDAAAAAQLDHSRS